MLKLVKLNLLLIKQSIRNLVFISWFPITMIGHVGFMTKAFLKKNRSKEKDLTSAERIENKDLKGIRHNE